MLIVLCDVYQRYQECVEVVEGSRASCGSAQMSMKVVMMMELDE